MQETQETWVQSLGQKDPLGNSNSVLYSCLENSMDRGAWGTIQSLGFQRSKHN